MLRQRCLYFITPPLTSLTKEALQTEADALVDTVYEAVRGGVDLVQWRQKPRSELDKATVDVLLPAAKRVRQITRDLDVPLIVNDSLELALQLEADGIHLGQQDLSLTDLHAKLHHIDNESFLIGATVRNAEQARAACEAGASYLGAGPVFRSSTKPSANDGVLIGLEGLKECSVAANEYGVPVFAISGVDETENKVHRCIYGGSANGVAVIAAISSKQDATEAAKILRQQVLEAKNAVNSKE